MAAASALPWQEGRSASCASRSASHARVLDHFARVTRSGRSSRDRDPHALRAADFYPAAAWRERRDSDAGPIADLHHDAATELGRAGLDPWPVTGVHHAAATELGR